MPEHSCGSGSLWSWQMSTQHWVDATTNSITCWGKAALQPSACPACPDVTPPFGTLWTVSPFQPLRPVPHKAHICHKVSPVAVHLSSSWFKVILRTLHLTRISTGRVSLHNVNPSSNVYTYVTHFPGSDLDSSGFATERCKVCLSVLHSRSESVVSAGCYFGIQTISLSSCCNLF